MNKLLSLSIFCCFSVIVTCIVIIQRKDTLTHVDSSFMIPQHAEVNKLNKKNSTIEFNFVKNKEISAHASALLAKDSILMMLFYAGTREGATDVKIYQSFLDLDSKKNKKWSEARALLTAKQLSKLSGRYIKKLGNPIVFKDANNKVHLFVVGVSLGGWATSRIYQFYFSDDLLNIFYVRELKLNPFANYSHLVRTPALPLNNGGFYLPIAHEMWRKFPLILYFDSKGNMIFAKRINQLKAQLQPTLAQVNQNECVALFRTNNRYNTNTYFQSCYDVGNQWDKVIVSNIHNYDSSLVLVNIGKNIVLIHNDGKHNPIFKNMGIKAGDRQAISLYWLKDKENATFEYLTTIDDIEKTKEKESTEVSYPSATIDNQNNLHIAYTYKRETIKHASINIDFIENLIESVKKN